jgi:hypothetical protein
MAEDCFVDVQYLGLELGKGLRIEDFSASSAYLHHPTPMPVGSLLTIAPSEDVEFPVRVMKVTEQCTGIEKAPGMVVEPQEMSESAGSWWQARMAGQQEAAAEVEEASTEIANAPEESAETEAAQAAEENPDEAANTPEAESEGESSAKKKKKKKRKKKR